MTAPTDGYIEISNTNIIVLHELKNGATDEYINDATVTVTIKDSNGVDLAGETWPVSMAYVTGSNGKYSGAISSAISVSAGDRVTAEITATSGSATGFWPATLVVRNRPA